MLLPLLTACATDSGSDVTPDACEGAMTDERVNVPFECDELGFLIKEAGKVGGTEIILAAGSYFIEGDLALKNDVHLRGEDPGDPPVIQVTGTFSALNALVEDLVVDGVVEARQSDLRRVTATSASLHDVVGSKLDFEQLSVTGELDLSDVSATEWLEVDGGGRLTRVVAKAGSVVVAGDSTLSGSRLPAVTIRPDTESRDRVDVAIQETTILGALVAHGGTSGSVYVHLDDSEARGLRVDNDVRAASLEIQVRRSVLQGDAAAVIDLSDADNYGLTVTNSLVYGDDELLATAADGLDLAETAALVFHNNVFVGGDMVFQQAPECGVASTASLDLRNNVFVDVTLDLVLLLDQRFTASHNLFVDSGCANCEILTGDECTHTAPRQNLDFLHAEGSLHPDDAGFEALDLDAPGDSDLHLSSSSVAVDAGVREWSDPDGTRSDIGLYGGQEAGE